MNKTRAALIGAGRMANDFHYPSLASFEDVELAALSDVDRNRLETTAKRFGIGRTYTDYRAMLDEVPVEAVWILMPPHYIFDPVMYRLERRKHVFIEKPPGITLERTRQMAACADSLGIYRHTISRKADIVIASAGGHPYDFDLVQTKKSIVPAMACVREGGSIILLGQCPDGWGGEIISRRPLKEQRPGDIPADLHRQFAAHDTPWESVPCTARYLFSKAVAGLRCRVIAVTGINADLAGTFIETADSLGEALGMAEERLGRTASVTVIPDGRRLIPQPGGSALGDG